MARHARLGVCGLPARRADMTCGRSRGRLGDLPRAGPPPETVDLYLLPAKGEKLIGAGGRCRRRTRPQPSAARPWRPPPRSRSRRSGTGSTTPCSTGAMATAWGRDCGERKGQFPVGLKRVTSPMAPLPPLLREPSP